MRSSVPAANSGCVHVIGAGIAGMAAALSLRAGGRRVIVHEAARHAGGRARSFHDPVLGCTIDNGNHLILAANHAVLDLLQRLGTRAHLSPPPEPVFPLFDRKNGCRITLRIQGLLGPFLRLQWQGSPQSCTPQITVLDYLRSMVALLESNPRNARARLATTGPLWRLFWEPFIVAVLNTPPDQADPAPLRRVLLETFGRGASALLPMLSDAGLSTLFATPFIERSRQDEKLGLHLSHPLRALHTNGNHVVSLVFDDEIVSLGPGDAVILAVPPWTAKQLLPSVIAPDRFSPIINVHFRLQFHAKTLGEEPRFLGIIGGTAQWLFLHGSVASVTISAADALREKSKEDLAQACWRDIVAALDLDDVPMPSWRLIVEKRATFLCTPSQSAKRPPADIGFSNLVLAGDWVNTGLPATLESAARSGEEAARLVISRLTC